MTLICSEGHLEHDELSCVSTFFRGKHPAPKTHRTRRRDLPIPHTRSLNGAHRAKSPRK